MKSIRPVIAYIASLIILFTASSVVPILASSVTDALYRGLVTVTNNSTAATGVQTVCSINSTSMVAQGFASDNLDDTVMQYNGVDVAFMPGYGTNPWCIWVDSIQSNSNLLYDLYSGGASGGKIRYFPGSTGMNVTDAATLELGGEFTVKQSGYFDIDTENYTVYKEDAFYIKNTTSGNITAAIYGNPTWTSPTGFTDSSGNWTEETNVYDDNSVTAANVTIAGTAWSAYLELNVNETLCESIKYEVVQLAAFQINLDIYHDGAWHDVFEGAYSTGNYTKDFNGIQAVSKCRISIYNNGGPGTFAGVLREVDFGVPHFVTATGLSDGDAVIEAGEKFGYFWIGEGSTTNLSAPSDNLVCDAQLHATASNTDPFTTTDSYGHSVDVVSATWSSTGYQFDGTMATPDHLAVEHNSVLSASDNMTVSAWFKVDSWSENTSNSYTICEKGNQYWLRLNSNTENKYPAFFVHDGTDWEPRVQYTTAPTAGVWHMLTGTYDKSVMRLYLDGKQVASAARSDNVGTDTGAYDLEIGRAGGEGNFFNGTIGELQVYKKSLSPDEIMELWLTSKGTFTGVAADNWTSGNVTVPDVSANWTFVDPDAMPYMNYTSISVNGTAKGFWGWSYSSTFEDATGNNHTATPTFRITSSDSDVSSVMTTFEPNNPAQTTTTSLTASSNYTILSTDPTAPSQLYTDGTFTNVPGADAINALLDESDTPRSLWWLPLIFISVAIIGLIIYAPTQSELMQVIVSAVLLSLFGVMNIIPFWPAIMCWIPWVAIILSKKHFSWG